MKNHLNYLLALAGVILFVNLETRAQKSITAILPADGAANVNVGILKWSGTDGDTVDLHFGLTANPPLYKENLVSTEEKPVILESNKKYYWKIVVKKTGKKPVESKVFTFTTLPIALNPAVKYNSLVDLRDYKVYWTLENGLEWMAQNLDYELPGNSWYYDNSESNKVYGKLYLGKALSTDVNKICPEGWHIPTMDEWNNLLNANGGVKEAGASMKESTEKFWRTSNYARNNNSGMTILPAGSRDSKPSYANLGKYTFFWTSTPSPKIPESFYNLNLGFMRNTVINDPGDPAWSYSIRCVKEIRK